MTHKSIIAFFITAVFSVGIAVFGWSFVDGQISEAVLTEETVAGNKAAAEGLRLGFQADSADQLHWTNGFDLGTGEGTSSFERGQITRTGDKPIYEEFRFAGWFGEPYHTRLTYEKMEGLQDQAIQRFYEEIQQRVQESGAAETGKIRVKDYLDYYPISFRFQFGTKTYHSGNALTGLKIYEEQDLLTAGRGEDYSVDVAMYTTFNHLFRIPVIENEYQEYKVTPVENYNYKTELACETDVAKPLGEGEDYYEFDPLIVLQQENILDGKRWEHPDLTDGLSYDADSGEAADGDHSGKTADAFGLKNRMLLAVNNRTVKGVPVDVSQITGGYGIYELPITVKATVGVTNNPKSWTAPTPEPVLEKLQMVYLLDADSEYVEMSLSGDHRYLAVFSVKQGDYYVDMVDADLWTSAGPMKMFPASETMTYAWGEDGSLAVINHENAVAILAKTGSGSSPYEILYSGPVPGDFDEAFFDKEMVVKENSLASYHYGIEPGLAVTVKDGKAALVQNLLAGTSGLRSGALECAIIDQSGILYRGRIKSNLTDLEYDMNDEDWQTIRSLLEKEKTASHLIQPVRSENWAAWGQ